MSKIELKHIDKFYGKNHILKDVNLTIEDGDFMTLLGPSGCGKTTTLRVVSGLEKPQNGTIHMDGKEIVNAAEAHFAPPSERDLNLVFQSYALWPHMTVRENIAFGLNIQKLPKDEVDRRIKDALGRMQIGQYVDRYPSELSGGQQQRVAIARAIASEPHLLLMDEPLSNLDAKLRGQMRVEISKLHQRLETTIIYVTHDQTEAMTLGTRIVVMKDGVVQQVDSPQNLYDRPCNKFVAGFIGAPQMNMIDAQVAKAGSDITLSFGGHTVALPAAKGKGLEEGGYIGKTVTLGIRPEDLHDEEAFLEANPKSIFQAEIRVYEMLGSEVLLYFDIDDANFTAKVNPRTTARPGDSIKVAMDLDKVHIFDKETEKVIIN